MAEVEVVVVEEVVLEVELLSNFITLAFRSSTLACKVFRSVELEELLGVGVVLFDLFIRSDTVNSNSLTRSSKLAEELATCPSGRRAFWPVWEILKLEGKVKVGRLPPKNVFQKTIPRVKSKAIPMGSSFITIQ